MIREPSGSTPNGDISAEKPWMKSEQEEVNLRMRAVRRGVHPRRVGFLIGKNRTTRPGEKAK